MRQQFKLEPEILPNGCWSPVIFPVVNFAIECALIRRKGDVRSIPRFMVKVDDEVFTTERVKALEKFMLGIAIDSNVIVFRNAGLGATIEII